jgi:hypothetical protein
MMSKVTTLYIFEQGGVAAFDRQGGQVCEEQAPLALRRLCDMVTSGAIDDDTVINTKIPVLGKCTLTGKDIRVWMEDV